MKILAPGRAQEIGMRGTLLSIAAGLITGLLLAALAITMKKSGHGAMPMPLGLAFAKAVLGHKAPLAAGIGFHPAYDTFWAVVYVALFGRQPGPYCGIAKNISG